MMLSVSLSLQTQRQMALSAQVWRLENQRRTMMRALGRAQRKLTWHLQAQRRRKERRLALRREQRRAQMLRHLVLRWRAQV